MEDSGKVVIRSFRLVFDRGYRRLFKIDRYRLPFAYGLPILGIVYAALASRSRWCSPRKLPVAGPALAALPPPIHWVAIPVGLSMVMLHWRPDGLKPHAALWAWLEAALTVRELSCWQPAERDADSARARRDRLRARRARGALPARPRAADRREVLLRYPARGWQRGRRLHVEQTSDQPLYVGTQITLRAGEQLVFEAPER